MENKPQRRRPPEERWEVRSGRVRVSQERPVSFQATIQRMLRSRGGRQGSGRASSEAPRRDPSSRRVVVKARVVQVGRDWGKKAAKLHLSYLERDGVERDGSPGTLYGAQGPIERSSFERDLPGEQRQFRIILSPEDGHALDLDDFVRRYMHQVEVDLGRRLEWAAVNHYNTDNPHAHIVIRGVDAQGAEVRLERDYVSNGLRHRAEDLATEKLGPRPERERIEQHEREVELERYTSLDRALERRTVDGVFRPLTNAGRDPHFEAALRKRLDVLTRLGLASRTGRAEWKIAPELRTELEQMARRAEGLSAIRAVLPVSANRCRVLDRSEPNGTHRAELDQGVHGILRSKGLDEQGQFCAVVETVGGIAYHLPISSRVAGELGVGQIVELKRAVDKDARIEEAAGKARGVYDLAALPELARPAYQRRLEQLERLELATREASSPDRWRVRSDFRAELAKGKPQPYWQMLALRGAPQSLDGQKQFRGHVWLDAVRPDDLAVTGFGREVREALEIRHAYLRELGLEPTDPKLRWKLRELQRRQLEQSLSVSRVANPIPTRDGFEGTVRLHRQPNREAFLEVRAGSSFVLVSAPGNSEALEGRRGRLHLEAKGRVRIEVIQQERERGPER